MKEIRDDNIVIIKKLSKTGKPFFLFSSYFPPTKKGHLCSQTQRDIMIMRKRYSSLAIFGYGDLNFNRTDVKRIPNLKDLIDLHYDNRPDSYTRESSSDKQKHTYIDYFYSKNCEVKELQIFKGTDINSDHIPIQIKFYIKEGIRTKVFKKINF